MQLLNLQRAAIIKSESETETESETESDEAPALPKPRGPKPRRADSKKVANIKGRRFTKSKRSNSQTLFTQSSVRRRGRPPKLKTVTPAREKSSNVPSVDSPSKNESETIPPPPSSHENPACSLTQGNSDRIMSHSEDGSNLKSLISTNSSEILTGAAADGKSTTHGTTVDEKPVGVDDDDEMLVPWSPVNRKFVYNTVCVTDVTANAVTITVRESSTTDGFFKRNGADS